MAGRRSERSRKSINYSKFSSGGNNSDKDDDDDFMEPSPPNKKKKTKKSPNTSANKTKNEKQMEHKTTERKARNRLSDEEKYQQQLEEVVKMSLVDSERFNAVTDNPNSSQDSTQSEQDTQSSCIVHAEVMDSPNTKLLQNTSTKREGKMEIRKDVILNEAASQCKDEEIISDPVEDNKETGKRKSGRSKKIKEKQEEDDYKMSDESESEDEVSVEEESDESDYDETPKKKQRVTKSAPIKEKESAPKKAAVSKKTTDKPGSITAPPLRNTLHANKENKVPLKTPVSLKKPALSRPSLTKTPTTSILPKTPTTSTLPKTPKSSTSLFVRRSPLMTVRPGKLLQKGWTPPGPAGSKTDILRSPQSQSPNYIRVGLSRNQRLASLHPKLNIK